ncbi:MOB kinase activator 2 isoform X2 [Strongylocentrotus purpuratus]|uniref:MOB kinase activator 2 n=1 Tax=Strongylocentrotus purpuratus TaxID=7668 RepID=A0A7M7HQX3_STRPU|nr:MOB kinase activator 2 isoform X2 [Strongylocentrotus purpuratus]|eukprot:XP_011681581.1 PREDICTED: MOB kinase activator 2 isoform X2 [Strongylocentrotus purpuratus]
MDWLMGKAGRSKEKSKPAPSPTEEPKLYLDAQNVKANIIEFDIREIVRLPHGLDQNEWLCTKTLSFFNNVNLLYGVLAGQFCTNDTCQSMMAPGNVIYQWHDDKGKKMKCSAPQYIEFAMVNAQKHIDDETIFPTKYGKVFPSDFESVIQRILRLMFQVLEHIYFAHYEQMTRLDLHHHLNTIFTHMVLYAQEFKLLEQKEISGSLEDLKEALHISLSLSSSSNPASSTSSSTSSSTTMTTASNSQSSSSNLNTNP